MPMELIKAEHVSKTYTCHRALDDVSISVPQGSIYGLLGPNGAGKTTLIRIINHITAPDAGAVYFDGHPLVASDIANIGYLPEERGLYKKMKAGEQAVFFARLKGLSRRDAILQLKEWFDRFGIADWWNKRVEELSKGMAQKLQFIITVLHRPKLLIFDEPFSGFDPINANLLKSEILRLRGQGATIIFSTHNMSSVEELCDDITLINKSHNILSGKVDEIRRRYGKNRYEFDFTGESKALENALSSYLTNAVTMTDSDGVIRMTANLNDGISMRRVIAAANEAVDLLGIKPSMPSMDEIFINTVGEYDKKMAL